MTTATDKLCFGYSPCPNDVFAFHALAHGLVGAPLAVTPMLHDIEELNQLALAGAYELTKASFGIAEQLQDTHVLLRSGAALGRGVGPLVVARTPMTLAEAARSQIAIPGRATTAYRLLRLAAGEPERAVELRYDRILSAVASGEVDAGLIIHESRFTYEAAGLVRVADLGEWWEETSGLPIPLAGIFARRDLGPDVIAATEAAIRASVEYAFAHPEASRADVTLHAQELSPEVCQAHIDLYVNEFSIDLGEAGLEAIAALTAAGNEPAAAGAS